MVLTVTQSNEKKIYNLSETRQIGQLIQSHKKKSKFAKKDQAGETDLCLIQNFEFPTASQKIAISNDLNYIIASGLYGPQLRIFDTAQLSMKCMRGMDSEIVDLQILSDDYRKIAMVCTDRNVELHAQYGRHFKTRVPKHPRCSFYNKYTANFLVGCSSDEIYRINLEEGRFINEFPTKQIGVNSITHNPYLDVTMAACDGGVLELFDNRAMKGVGTIQIDETENLTALRLLDNAYEFILGSSEGSIKLFDLRYHKPVTETRHPYMLPINSIEYHTKMKQIVSSDSKSIRIYAKDDFDSLFLAYEPMNKINQVKVFDNSGLILMATETSKIGSIFVPSLGVAPKFCEFLENITEELEEKISSNVNEDLKFVTYEELLTLNATHLINSGKARAHLHGFTIRAKLYDAVKAKSEGFDYDQYKQQKIQEAIDKKLSDRIYVKQDKIKINNKYFHKLNDKKEKLEKKEKQRASIIERRFGKMFTNKDYEIDEKHESYRIRNPNKRVNKRI